MATEKVAKSKQHYRLNSVEDGLTLLTLLFQADVRMTLSELTMASGINKNKTFRLLATFEQSGVLDKDQQGRYSPSTSTLFTAHKILSKVNMAETMRPILQNVAGLLNEAVYFAKKTGKKRTLIYLVDSNQSVRVRSLIGSVLREWPTENNQEQQNDSNVIEGVTVSTGAIDPEIITVAIDIAPVSGKDLGSVVVVAPTFRMSPERIKNQVIPVLHETVWQMGQICSEPMRKKAQPADDRVVKVTEMDASHPPRKTSSGLCDAVGRRRCLMGSGT